MDKDNLMFDDAKLANILREEILKNSVNEVKPQEKRNTMPEIEYVSTSEKPYVSPIMTMTEDEILDFVEEFDVAELATLSVAELNRIGEVLGVEPKILVEGM